MMLSFVNLNIFENPYILTCYIPLTLLTYYTEINILHAML